MKHHKKTDDPLTSFKAAIHILLYVPNIIGYSRILLTLLACYVMREKPTWSMSCYGLSCLLDALDGYAARVLNQCSRLGAVLDMITDRFTTACLLVMLAHLYPQFMLVFQSVMSLDLASHYSHMYSMAIQGAASHKIIDKKQNWLLRHYYGSRIILFLICAGNEMFFMCLYILYYIDAFSPFISRLILWFFVWITLPICLLKQWIHLVQLASAIKTLMYLDIMNPKPS
jgi:CDP-diacylglycerol--inositol 3-phosphatidyltransferase